MKRASDYGFSVQASGEENSRALQRAVLGGGTILVDEPGDYRMRESVLKSGVGQNTSLEMLRG